MKSKILIYFLPVLMVMFMIYGYTTQDGPDKDSATTEKATNSLQYFNSTIGTVPSDVNAAVLYDQAELVSNPGAGFGGADASAITDPGTLFGFGNQQLSRNRMGDDFTIPAGETWNIDSVIVFQYQTGSPTTSTINNMNLQIWDGANPGTGNIVAGDSTTNRLTASKFSNIYRVSATTLTNNQRPIMRNQVNMNGASLSAGTYWLDYSAAGTLASGPWAPPRTIPGTPATGNAQQRTGTSGAWAAALDGVNPQGVPFIIYGTLSGPPAGGSITVHRNGLSLAIPDNGGNSNGISDDLVISGIPAGNEIKKITVTIDSVPHTWIGDLRFWLTKGSLVDTVISRVGWTGTGFGNSCNDFYGTNLYDSVGPINVQNISTVCIGIQAASSGYFNPKNPLAPFQNAGIDPNGTYNLKISDNAAGDLGTLKAWSIKIDYDVLTGVSGNTIIANDYNLSQNYPNPFNPTTNINFSIPKSGLVTVKVYDLVGKEVAVLVNEVRNAGNHEITFNGSNLSSGAYFYRIQSGEFVDTKKMFLLK